MTRNETRRYAVLNVLAPRQVAAFTPMQIASRLNIGAELDQPTNGDELAPVCEFLVGSGLAERIPEPLGSTIYFKATSQGVVTSERWRDAKGIL